MTAATALDLATIREYCRVLRLATVAAPWERLAQEAAAAAVTAGLPGQPAGR